MTPKRTFAIGLLLPVILATAFFVDATFRVLPMHWLAFRVLESAQRRSPSCMGPFQPNALFVSSNSYGDLASLGNLPAMRQYRDVSFSTDNLGFHNPEELGGVPEAIVIGDSFAISSEVDGDKTFASELSRLLGRPVYNAGEDEALVLAPLKVLTKRLKMGRAFVIFEFLERHLSEAPPFSSPTGKDTLRSFVPTFLGAERWDEWRLPVWHAFEYSPLQALSVKCEKFICNDELFPNRFAKNVLVRRLSNGDSMLFLPRDVSDSSVSRNQVEKWAAYWEWLSEKLKQDNLTLVVLLVPNKYTVFQPYFSPVETELAGRQNLNELETRLLRAHLPVVGLVDIYRQTTAEYLSRHQYLYWKDDTHWNALGMAVAANAVFKLIQISPAAAASSDPGNG